MGLTLGPSGFPFYGSDTGGYRHSPPDEETYVRWFQQTALSTVMQVGDSSSQPPWVFTEENGRDEETLVLYREYARLHLRLFPYVWTYAKRIEADGRPIQRALGLAHPELGVHPSDEYLMGDHLLVAPVLERDARERRVIFPEGEWFDWWDGSLHSGDEVVEAPLSKLPLYLRAGGIVPMLRPTIDTLSPATDAGVESYAGDPGRLYVRIAKGPASTFVLYDGTTIENAGATIVFTGGEVFDRGATLELIGYGSEVVTIDVPDGRTEVAAP
jgi:alpha-D-xyloside xylohydrolase